MKQKVANLEKSACRMTGKISPDGNCACLAGVYEADSIMAFITMTALTTRWIVLKLIQAELPP